MIKRLIFFCAMLSLPAGLLASVTSTTEKSGPWLVSALPQTIPTTFSFQQGSDLLVLDTGPTLTPNDPAIILVLGSDYTVTGGGYNTANQMQVGSIVVVGTGLNAVQVNDYIVIMRNVAINQTQSLVSTGPLTAILIEQALDKMATLSQQVNEIGSRSLQFENFEFGLGTLNKAARSSMLLGFDANGNIKYYATGGGGGGIGTVTAVTAGTGLSATTNPIVSTGTLSIANSGVSASTYGTATAVPQITVNAQGQITAATNVNITTGAGTVTHTAGNLTSGHVVIGNASADIKVDSAFTTDGSGAITDTAYGTAGVFTNNASGVVASLSNASSVNSTLMGILGTSWSSSDTLFLTASGKWLTAAGSGNVSTSGSITSGYLAVWNGATTIVADQYLPSGNFPALTGDTTTTAGAVATSTVKIHGVSYGASPSTNTVPVVTGTNATTYETVPVAAGGTGATSVAAASQAMTPATVTVTESGGSATVNWAQGNSFYMVLNANCTLAFSNAVDGQIITFAILNTASNWTVTWPTIKWTGGAPPVMTTGAHYDVYTVWYNATVGAYFGSYVQNF